MIRAPISAIGVGPGRDETIVVHDLLASLSSRGASLLVIGSGAREHALCLSLAADPAVTALVCAPGNAGTAAVAEQRGVDPLDPAAVAALAVEVGADLVVIGPEAPLVAGVADAVRAAGIACFGPSAAAAQLEGSKAFAKDVMAAAGVPTAAGPRLHRRRRRPARRSPSSGRRTWSRTTGWPPARASSSPTTSTRRWPTPPAAGGWSSRSTWTAPRCRCSASPTAPRRGETIAGVFAVAAPIHRVTGSGPTLVAGLSVAGPSDRLRDRIDELRPHVVVTAAQIESALRPR